MILDKSIEMMIKHFDDRKFVFGDRPETAYEGAFNAYVHVPFCMSTCDYCPFYKELYQHVKKCGYHRAILEEIEKTPFAGRLEKLKIGGGTPNLLSIDEIEQIINGFRKKTEVGTISIQLLGSILSESYLRDLQRIGVNTIEIGYESFSKEYTTNFSRRTESAAQFLNLIQFCRSKEMDVCVNVLAGLPEQRETSFVEDIFLIAEMLPQRIGVQPLIDKGGVADERAFEMVEMAAEVLVDKGYTRTNLWRFEWLTQMDDTASDTEETTLTSKSESLPLLGFGPSAYSKIDGYHRVNPDMDLYIYEQLYGQSRVLSMAIKSDDQQWLQLVNQFYRMDGKTTAQLSNKLNWYLRWLQLSGFIKNHALTEKGIMYAHTFVFNFRAHLPNPVINPQCIENPIVYEAERAFASISIQQMENTLNAKSILGMPVK